MSAKINIAIDGPAASGKSAAGRLLAKEIAYIFIDTGIIYRAFTLFCLQNNFNLQDQDFLISALKTFDIKWKNKHFLFNGQIVNDAIYNEEVTKNVALIASVPEIRNEFVLKIQEITQEKGFVVVGRDITSVVLPDAQLKIFLTSSLKVRSERRWKQYLVEGVDISQETVYQDMLRRDKKDENRAVAPLTIVDDAIILDNSDYDLKVTVKKLLDIFLTHRKE